MNEGGHVADINHEWEQVTILCLTEDGSLAIHDPRLEGLEVGLEKEIMLLGKHVGHQDINFPVDEF